MKRCAVGAQWPVSMCQVQWVKAPFPRKKLRLGGAHCALRPKEKLGAHPAKGVPEGHTPLLGARCDGRGMLWVRSGCAVGAQWVRTDRFAGSDLVGVWVAIRRAVAFIIRRISRPFARDREQVNRPRSVNIYQDNSYPIINSQAGKGLQRFIAFHTYKYTC